MTARTVTSPSPKVNTKPLTGGRFLALGRTTRRRPAWDLGTASLTHAADVASDGVDVADGRAFRGGVVGVPGSRPRGYLGFKGQQGGHWWRQERCLAVDRGRDPTPWAFSRSKIRIAV